MESGSNVVHSEGQLLLDRICIVCMIVPLFVRIRNMNMIVSIRIWFNSVKFQKGLG